MTVVVQSTKRKLSLLQLAEELGNVSKAFKIMGYHRDSFYEIRRAFQVRGTGALVEEKQGRTLAEAELARRPHSSSLGARRLVHESMAQHVLVVNPCNENIRRPPGSFEPWTVPRPRGAS